MHKIQMYSSLYQST